jgi:putative transposase
MRGKMVRELASREYIDLFGRVRISRQTPDRWIPGWRRRVDALVPNPPQSTPRTPAEVLELAVALRRENPDRTAAAIQRILRTQLGWALDERTLQRHFHRLGLTTPTTGSAGPAFGR